ncbi:helix-turn-helix domain-containing protein [Streptantibioticus rubrisoli]|uniref:Helix-turn-helix domain-containing protein n=1 Tax=Streptantibioticus rubrisoli TaxID=1387313 RepID=A0ABT1P8Z8_9ACTN|nr:helix-turn-helix transcriptional regulator [Streptantibioticus rubrisoli]MCQ4041810.1 helix-turn-helix domain-containing protein [Streptantibioticus rubrisoli]
MTQPKSLDGSANPRAFFGAELRRLRTAAELTQERLGSLVYLSGDTIAKVEKAVRVPTEELAQRLDAALGTDGHFDRLFRLAEKSSKHPQFFALHAELERTAQRIEEFSPYLVPGLIQTEGYAREIFRAFWPYLPDEQVNQKVKARLDRAALLDKDVEYWAVLDEMVLKEPGLPPSVMREQVQHIVALIKDHRAIVQVLSRSAGMHALRSGPLTILTLQDSTPVAYVEAPHTGQLLDSAEQVHACRLSYDLVRAAALPPPASLELIESTLEEYGT